MPDTEVRVRFAPSPTGFLHVGGVRTALYNYLFARKHKGTFILRIEDTDQTRYVKGAEQYIVDSLKWSGIEIDEGIGADNEGPYGPYRQSERMSIYAQYAEQMVKDGKAYYAFDTSEELEEFRERMKKAGKTSPKYDHITREYMKNSESLPQDEVKKRLENGDPYVIRIKIPRNEEIKLKDEIRGFVSVNSNELDDKVLLKADGMPTYHLANVVDDHLMKISHVIRGEEWLPSAPLHVLLYRFLGWEETMPKWAHLPLILKPDGKGKLSKRDGEKGGFPVAALRWQNPESGEVIEGYREMGYFPEAFVNILALLGWSPHDNRELFSIEELKEVFSLDRVGKSGAKFDPDKAKWLNQQYMREMDNAKLAEVFTSTLKEKGINADRDFVEKACSLIKEKAAFTSDFWELGYYFFERPKQYDEKVIAKRWSDISLEFFNTLVRKLENLNSFEAAVIQENFNATAEEMDQKAGAFMQLFRVLVTGAGAGPALFEMMEVLGKEEVIERLKSGIQQINQEH